MPQYIPNNQAMLQAFLQAQKMKAERPGDTQRKIAEAVANAVNQHYKNKEMKLIQAKADKEKEFNGLVDYLQKNEILKLPTGTTGETKVEGYTPIPSGMQEILQKQGMPAQYFRPREKPIKAEPVIGAAGRKVILAQTGKDLSEDTPIRLAQNLIKPEPLPKDKIAPPGYRYVGNNLEAIPGGPADVKSKAAEAKPTVAQTVVDRLFAKTYEDYIASGGYADLISQIDSLSEVKKALQAGKDNLTGPVIGNLPLSARAIKYPESIKVQEQAEQTIQRTLRTTLGAQFTEKEGMLFMRRGYNPTLKESINVQKIDEMIAKLKVAGEAKRSAVEYYEQNGTLTGYKGKIYRLNKKGELITVAPTVKSITGQPPAAPAKAAPKDDLDKALDDLGI